MIYSHKVVVDFWCTPWSEAFRKANVWLERFGPPLSGKRPDKEAPSWVRPLCVQRWVGQTIAERLAWVGERAERRRYRYGQASEPRWDERGWQRYPRGMLRQFNEEGLLEVLGREVERLLRMAEEHPSLVGQVEWTEAALGASEHVAQVYGELRRRYRAERARGKVQAALRGYLAWRGEGESEEG